MAIRIFLADDHHVVRRGLQRLLEQEPDFSIVGEAENGQQIIDLLNKGIEGDVLLTDLSMPVMDGIQLAEMVKEKYPRIKIILLTIQEEDDYIQKAFQAGVNSYLFKTTDAHELVYAIRQAANGKAYLCSGLSARLISRILAWSLKNNNAPTDVSFSLRELEVLQLIADGYTNEEAADKLFTSKRTVEGHRQAMLDKTGSRNSMVLMRYAVRHGLIN